MPEYGRNVAGIFRPFRRNAGPRFGGAPVRDTEVSRVSPEKNAATTETTRTRKLRKEAADFFGFGDAFDPEAQRGSARGHFFFAAQGQSLVEGAFHDAEKFVHHFSLGPEEALEVLDPFEVGDDDAARVAENVRDDEDFGTLIEDEVRFGRGRAVGGFGEDAALDFGGILAGNLALNSGRDKNVARGEEKLFVGDGVGAGKTGNGFVGSDVFVQREEVEPGFVDDAAADVADGDDFNAIFGQCVRCDGTDVPIALDNGSGFFGIHAQSVQSAVDEVSDAAAGGFSAAE